MRCVITKWRLVQPFIKNMCATLLKLKSWQCWSGINRLMEQYSLETNVVIYDKVYILYSSHILYSYTLKDIYYVQIRKGMGYSKIFNVQ